MLITQYTQSLTSPLKLNYGAFSLGLLLKKQEKEHVTSHPNQAKKRYYYCLLGLCQTNPSELLRCMHVVLVLALVQGNPKTVEGYTTQYVRDSTWYLVIQYWRILLWSAPVCQYASCTSILLVILTRISCLKSGTKIWMPVLPAAIYSAVSRAVMSLIYVE